MSESFDDRSSARGRLSAPDLPVGRDESRRLDRSGEGRSEDTISARKESEGEGIRRLLVDVIVAASRWRKGDVAVVYSCGR